MSPLFQKSKSISILVATAFFMENLDGTVIATALPQMGVSFHTNPVDLNIGMTAYLLMLAVFIPISGWVADRVGARTVFVSAIAIFTASSVLCGLSNGIWTFTGARVIQGIGGAMMMPVGRLVVLRTTEKHNLIDAITFITWPGLIAPVLGPPLGGFITTYASWHWIFFLNVPLGIIGMALSSRIIPNLMEDHVKPFDWIGFVLSASACVSFVYGMELVGRESAHWKPTAAYLIAGCVLGVFSVLHLLRSPAPLLKSRSPENQDVCDLFARRIALSNCDQRVSIPPAAYVSGRLWTERVSVGPPDARPLHGQFAHEKRGDAHSPEVRIPHCADDERYPKRDLDGGLRPAVSSDREEHRAFNLVCERPVPLDAVYGGGHSGLCGHRQAGHELRHQLLQHDHANVDGHGRGCGRDRAAYRRIPGRQ